MGEGDCFFPVNKVEKGKEKEEEEENKQQEEEEIRAVFRNKAAELYSSAKAIVSFQ